MRAGRLARSGELVLGFPQRRLLAHRALYLDLLLQFGEPRAQRPHLRVERQIVGRERPLELAELLAHLRGALLEVGERGVVARA